MKKEIKSCRLFNSVRCKLMNLGIKESTFYNRFCTLGYSFEESFLSKEEVKKKGIIKKTKWFIKGTPVRHLLKNNNDYITFLNRVKKGVPVNQAFNTPFNPRKIYYFDGKRISEVFTKKACDTIRSRMRIGWGLYTACTRPVEIRKYGRVWLEDLERIKIKTP